MDMDIAIYSGGIGGGTLVSPSIAHQSHNYLFTPKNILAGNALSARPYWWQKKRFRGIIYVGLNTLSRVYKLKHISND